ncbi:hypothetical protein JZ751_012054 [Albula glossodonta]|uniref:Rab-GAP TBC domain-containing protein n=1 Tax=Albula glossodonta TaxID=121402 RepID=A0A8T2PRE4_9TELE|nr:hypothetical protein JZ751_012054 [Albula glossodonta]
MFVNNSGYSSADNSSVESLFQFISPLAHRDPPSEDLQSVWPAVILLRAEDVPPEVLRQREVKWLEMLNHWDKWMAKRHKKVKLRCQKGIPPSLRGRAWLYLSGGKVKREQNPGKFQDAFWGLVQICEKYLPGYYSAGLEAIQLDGEILFALLRRVSPVAHRHLKKHKMEPILYMTEWFMCAFSRTLPWASVLRVWDMFFCDGVKIIFRVLELPVSERDIEKEHHTQLRRWKETNGELRCKSPPRMHGARAIMAAEPPSRQDLRQNPTIIVQSPLAPSYNPPPPQPRKEEEERSGHTGNEELTDPSPSDLAQPLVKDTALQGSSHSLSSTEHDTYL